MAKMCKLDQGLLDKGLIQKMGKGRSRLNGIILEENVIGLN